jgi:hypothetical protein
MYVSHIVIGANSVYVCVCVCVCVSHAVIGASSICVCLMRLLEQAIYVCVSYGYWSKQYMCVSHTVNGANTDHLPKQY